MTLRFLILLFTLIGVGSLAAQSSSRVNDSAKRGRLFVGSDSSGVGWLPKTDLLPEEKVIESAAQKLGVRVRNVDPFGLPVFPREEMMPLFEDDSLRETPRITLNQALQTLRINAVNLARKEFLIGGRNVFQGDVVELLFNGEIFQAQVIEVGYAEMHFRDIIRGESGVLPHNLVPRLALEPIRKAAPLLNGKALPVEPVKTEPP